MANPIEYERLNGAAQSFYDVAFAAGIRAGREQASHETVEHVGRGLLEVAALVLRLAVDLDEPAERRRAAEIARRIYGRTPGGHSFDAGRLPWRFDRVLRSQEINAAEARDLIGVLEALGKGERAPA